MHMQAAHGISMEFAEFKKEEVNSKTFSEAPDQKLLQTYKMNNKPVKPPREESENECDVSLYKLKNPIDFFKVKVAMAIHLPDLTDFTLGKSVARLPDVISSRSALE